MKLTSAADTALAKWGNATAIRIPKSVMQKASLREGDPVTFEVQGPGVIVMRAKRALPSLRELLAGVTTDKRHAETDWGEPIGNEVW